MTIQARTIGLRLAAVCIGVGLVAVCGAGAFAADLKIGFTLSLTGGTDDYGKGARMGAELAIKEYNDKGMKGAEWMSITPITGQQAPPCSREHGPGEKVFKEEGDERLGYFRGVKGDYVFFTAADGINGGMPFSVHDSNTGKVAFADSAYWGGMWNKPPEPSPFNDLRVTSVPGQPLTLTYLRVVATECDLHLWKKDACWGRVRREFGIKDAQMPTCTGYDNIDTRTSLPLLTRSRFRCQSRPWSKRSQVR